MQGFLKDLRRVVGGAVLAALAALVMLVSSADHGFAATFTPTGEACLDNETTIAKCDGATTPGAVSGITAQFVLPKGDANFSAVVNFIPSDWFVANGKDVPDGAIVAKLTAGATLGLLGGACNSGLQPVFIMMDATVDSSTQVTFDDGFDDNNGDGLPDAVTKYPDFIARQFPGKTLKARLYGQADVSGVDVSLNFLLFNPGEKIKDTETDAKLGYPSVTILQNLGDPEIVPSASAITDFCSPLLAGTTTYGTTQDNPATAANEGGIAYRKNPAKDGTYNYVTYALSQRDPDNDGLETGLDTCPFHAGTFNPREGQWGTPQEGDKDGDRIGDECDEKDDSAIGADSDNDKDSYLNAGDNCPQVTNGISSDKKKILGPNNQKDTDEDGIGDECDIAGTNGIGQGPSVADGDKIKLCGVFPLTIGAGGPADPNAGNRVPCGTYVDPTSGPNTGPTPTLAPGQTPRPTGAGGVDGGPVTGIGTLAPTSTSWPAWAAFTAAAGGIGLLVGIGALAWPRLLARRRKD